AAAVAPEGDEIEIGGVEHQLDAEEHEDGVAARERAGEADGEERGREQEAEVQRRHGWRASGEDFFETRRTQSTRRKRTRVSRPSRSSRFKFPKWFLDVDGFTARSLFFPARRSRGSRGGRR